MTDIYPVGLWRDVRLMRGDAKRGVAGLRRAAKRLAAVPRAARSCGIRYYLAGYAANHLGCPHGVRYGWTRRSAQRRADRTCEHMRAAQDSIRAALGGDK